MDTEQQIRLNFLEEAEEYFDEMESNLVGLANSAIEAQQIDFLLRSAHSIKGGAAMMGFTALSKVAHRLEDFFKILRVRYSGTEIALEIETLLLQGIDCLRTISELNQEGYEVAESDILYRTEPVFTGLQSHLGDLAEADEHALLAQDEDTDPALLIFEEGVEEVLERFESQLAELEITQIAEELVATASELNAFGNMASLEPFVQLCQSIENQTTGVAESELEVFAKKALEIWKRSHALVLRGKLDKLPSSLEGSSVTEVGASPVETQIEPQVDPEETPDLENIQATFAGVDSLIEESAIVLEDIQSALNSVEPDRVEPEIFEPAVAESEVTEPENIDEVSSLDLSALQSAFTDVEPEVAELEAIKPEVTEPEVTELENIDEVSSLDLSALQSAFTDVEPEIAEPEAIEPDTDEASSLDLSALQSAFADAEPEVAELELTESEVAEPEVTEPDTDEASSLDLSALQSAFADVEPEQTPIKVTTPKSAKTRTPQKAEKMVRVPASQLQQFNNLFEQLVLNRNRIDLKLKQLQEFTALANQRVAQMERSNTNLKKWYDQASLEGFLSEGEIRDRNAPDNNLVAENAPTLDGKISEPTPKNIAQTRTGFDALEMDRYTDIHLICQEQIETIVQLQEATTDIDFGLQEITQAVNDLSYTAKSMQGNVTRTQMLPFADVVKRFPRVIRDLSLQFNKQVNLKIVGENTLLDRSIIEALSDPLMHLLRNAFDHGIEDSATRIAAGKDPKGTITISASSQGTNTVITLKDDGGGISLEKIRERVVQMGITPTQVKQISEAELLDFIFEPGFSTAKQVTELSGRGVGMDVVRTNLQEIRGDVRVSSEAGVGTTFTLRIPFNLSILRVAIVEQAGIIFAVPANLIRELVLDTATEEDAFSWNNGIIPLVKIDRVLGYNRAHRGTSLTGNPAISRPMTLVVGNDLGAAAFPITRFWQEQESTIRSIDSPIALPDCIVSSVVFGDGKVIPLLDPFALLESPASTDTAPVREEITATPEISAADNDTILIVDDSINVRRYLSLTLEKAGYRVEQAKDGREAVDKLFAGLRVQAVISDVEMPRLDGYGVLEEVKEKSEFAELPIIMLTSRSNEKHRKLALNLGASAYFSKPYNEQELLQTLQELVSIAS